ncbi:MAG: hypothetical protein JW779_05915 [Candidatus Thorarchaeota archaeon]|nr:hypothetical protein [Candidatus Thorarchaeota archaeon]
MRSMRLINKTFTLFLLTLFVVSFAMAGNSAAIPQQDSIVIEDMNYLASLQPVSQSTTADTGTNVNWYTDTGHYNNTWTWSNNNWLFGPEASYEIFYDNGSQVDKLDYLPVSEQITWKINIPKNVLRGSGINSVYINGWYIVPPEANMTASFNIDFYNGTPATWSVYSYSWNRTNYESGPPFLTINQPGCSLTEDSAMYYVTYKITFLEEVPVGLYGINIQITDSDYNSHTVKSRYASTYESDKIAIGIPRSLAYSEAYHGGYTLEKQDLSGDLIYSVSRETDFMMRFNITGNGDLDYAMLWSYFSGQMKIPVNRTGYHDVMVTKTGGWVWNPEIQTYIYNNSIEFTIPERVWGEYTEYEYYYGSDYREYEYRYLMYNATTGLDEVYTSTSTQQMQLMFVFNFTTWSFETLYGFTYTTYPFETFVPGVYYSETIFYTEPIENAPFQMFELNLGLSNAYSQDGVVSVEFIGHFTEDAPKGSVVNFYDMVVDKSGFYYGINAGDTGDYPMTWQEYNDAKSVAVESPVTIAKLLRPDDSPVYGWFFPAKSGEEFKVRGRLQGGADLASDIDGAIFEMKSYDSHYTDTSYGYTDMYYEILVESDATVTMTAYNYTALNNYTYGYHWEWGQYLATGWHYEYNETSGETIWVYGDYYTYGEQWVEGWYWDWFYFNQKTGEWVNYRDWYYYDYRSEATKVNTAFAEVSNITIYTSGGDLYYSFLVNLTDYVREISHWWDFRFANSTWIEDPSSEMGFHDIGIWRSGWIHSFDHMGEEVYVDVTSKIGVYNSSISGISDWLPVEETPYISIDGVDYPIKVRNIMYSYSTTTEERILFYDNDGEYYELLNGTKIYIQSERTAFIYNVTIPFYGSFLTTQKHAYYWYDGVEYWNSWIDINGNVHQGTDYSDWDMNAIVEYLSSSDIIQAGYYLRVGESTILRVQDYPRSDPRTGTEYILDEFGTRYDLVYVYGYQYIDYEGLLQRVSYTQEYFNATYLSSPVFVPGWQALQEQWFTVEGHNEMPYPGALADWSGVYYTDAEYYGKVPTTKTIGINEQTYFVEGNPDMSGWNEYDNTNHTGFWVIIDSTNYSLDGQRMWHASVNGTSYWQPAVVGRTLDYGSFDGMAFEIEGSIGIITESNYYVSYLYNSSYNYEYEWWVDLENGTVLSCEPRTIFEVYLVNANGTFVYTYNPYPYEEYISETERYYYILDLDGIRHYVDNYYKLPVQELVVTVGWVEYNTSGFGTFHYFVNGTEYFEDYSGGHGGVTTMVFTNGTLSGKYFFRWSDHDNVIYEIVYEGTTYQTTSSHSYIYQVGSVLGQALVYKLQPIPSVTFKNFNEIIVGNPRWALWGVQTWAKSDVNNALDLDGDLSTTDDQYYVLSEYQSTNSWTSEWSRMWVDLVWDPNGTLFGDEMYIHSWMGVETYTWSYQWAESFYWYHADDFTPVDSAEWTIINSTILNEDGLPRAGYWDIAHMANNVTWEDIVTEAIENGWDWFDQGEQTWTWLSFGVGQHYGVDTETGWSSLDLRYEYSGLMIWEDGLVGNNSVMETYMTNPGDGELTHYFIPDSVDSVSFVTPGMAYSVPDASGSLQLDIEDEVTWGVTFSGINGTTFPFNAYAYWDWYGGVVTGTDLRTFDERPTKVAIDMIEFLVHFQGHLNSTEGATSNYATMKVDNTVGQWGVDLNGGIENLDGKSLALNYLADISTSQFKVNASAVGQEDTIVSDRFEIGDTSAKFAEMIIGGVTYEWAGDPYTQYNVSSQTTPYSTFTSAYQSDNGQSATSWAFTSTQYYVSIGFPEWDGLYVYQDPVFVGYISTSGQTGGDSVEFSAFSINPSVPTSSDSVEVTVDIYSDYTIWNVNLVYSTDGENYGMNTAMSKMSDTRWNGVIPPFSDDTQIWYKIVAYTDSGTFESAPQSYIVGQGMVTITPTFPTTTTGSTGPTWTGEGPSLELIMMIGGIGLVVVMIAAMARRRK